MSGKNRNRNDKRQRRNATWGDTTLSSTLSELSVSESRCSGYARDSLEIMRNALSDPFGSEAQRVVQGFHHYVTTFPRNGSINLEECSLLLQGSTKVLGKQVKEASSFISELAAFVTNTASPDNNNEEEEGTKEKKGRKKKDAVENGEPSSSTINESQGSGITHEESSVQVEQLPEGSQLQSTSIANDSMDVSGGAATTLSLEDSVGDINRTSETVNESGLTGLDSPNNNNSSISDSMMMMSGTNSSVQLGDNNNDSSTVDPSLNLTNCDIPDHATTANGDSILQSSGAEDSNSTLNNTQNTIIPLNRKDLRKSKETGQEAGQGIPRKKSKLFPVNPPYLTSIIDIEAAMETDEDSDYDEYPPILFPEVDLWNGQFDLQADPDAPPPPPPPATSLNDELTQRIDGGLGDVNNDMDTNMEVDLPTQPLDGHETIPILNSAASLLTNSTILNGVTSSVNSIEFPALTPEDQQEIQNCINQLHYLPFTCELSTEELERTFRNTVDKLEMIFKKYNLPFNRSLLTAASAVCANMVKSTLKNAEKNQQQPQEEERAENFREIFSQGSDGINASTLEALINSTQTIFERTKEKSVAESKATIQSRLKEMQRSIVPKYIQLPLIQENTPEFFRRVKQFEQKMKKVLADEENKETFDVSKYEIEVLQATAREAQAEEILDLEESGDETITSRPDCAMDDSMEIHQGDPCSPCVVPLAVVRSPSIASNAASSSYDFNRKWVPLSHVFNHMKKFDRNECARHFYAVLALLSSQNLDMNYDRHYSEESAKVVTTRKDDSQDSKYPRGVKIMTSRCPDADKEEIYVTALASKSCNETFRDLISQEMHLHENQHGGSTKGAHASNFNSDHNSDSDSEFVTVNCTNLTSISGNLFGNRKKKRTN